MSTRSAALATVLGLAAIVLVVAALYATRTETPSTSPPPTVAARTTASPAATVPPSPPPTAAPSPSPTVRTTTALPTVAAPTATAPAAGSITGALGYPSEFVPPVTVYAISTTDQRVWSAVEVPRFPPATGTPPPQGPRYTITGVAPGTYHVLAYRDDGAPGPDPGLYSRYVTECRPGASSAACADHTLVPVTVRAGQTTTGIDVTDWYYTPQTRPSVPPRPTPR